MHTAALLTSEELTARTRWEERIRHDEQMTATTKLVAAALARGTPTENYCHGVRGLMDYSGLSKASVLRALASLDAAGLIDRSRAYVNGGGRIPDTITLRLDACSSAS